MFESNVLAETVVERVKNEIEASLPFSDAWAAVIINEVEQSIYSGLVDDRTCSVIHREDLSDEPFDDDLLYVSLSDIGIERAEDIRTVLTDGIHELMKMPYELMYLPNAYCIRDGYVGIRPEKTREMRVFYRSRPVLKDENNLDTETIKLPVEFVGMVADRIFGEAYSAIGAYAESGYYFNEYNNKLQAFTDYVKSTSAAYGRA